MSPSYISEGEGGSWSSGSSYIAKGVTPGGGEWWIVVIGMFVARATKFSGCNSMFSVWKGSNVRVEVQGLRPIWYQSIAGVGRSGPMMRCRARWRLFTPPALLNSGCRG